MKLGEKTSCTQLACIKPQVVGGPNEFREILVMIEVQLLALMRVLQGTGGQSIQH